MANFVKYDLTGGTNFCGNAPNVMGAAIARNMFTEANTEGEAGKDIRTFLQSCPGIKYLHSLGDNSNCDGLYVPSTGLSNMDYEQCLFVAYKGSIHRIDNAFNDEVVGHYALGNTVQFAESGGERAILLWVDGNDIHGYNLKDGTTVDITLSKRIDAEN